MHFSIDRTVHTTAFDKPVVDHWLERKIAQTAAGSTEKDRSDDRPLQRRARPVTLSAAGDILNYSFCLFRPTHLVDLDPGLGSRPGQTTGCSARDVLSVSRHRAVTCKQGRKEMVYLTTHSTHFIYGYMEGRKEGRKWFI